MWLFAASAESAGGALSVILHSEYCSDYSVLVLVKT
jgi:hypothetical protein